MTNDEAIALIRKLRWPPDGKPRCPRCGSETPYLVTRFRRWRCRNRDCKADFTLLGRTLFSDGKLRPVDYYNVCMAFADRERWACGAHCARRAKIDYKAAQILVLKLETVVADGERVSGEEVLRRALHAKPQPERWRKFRPRPVQRFG